MSFSQEALSQIAHLARLTITDLVQQQKDMDRIVTMVEKIEAIDTNDVAPMAHPLDMVQRLTPDLVTECVNREAGYPDRTLLQSVSPSETQEGLYLVPKVIE
ncbi:MAG: Asp-tRNA(Asn)/Glu-tRNA(Gln) amidotransferase subunit GatC [Pseudomonadota bacterium]|jgi:aspartyl-tRNA(Asn)/glutamyl-tRNA(Gln) amidotransferase subunit C